MAKYVLCSFGALAFAMAVIGAASAIAGEEKLRPVDSAECKEITARVIEATGATFGEYSLLGDNVFLNHTLVPDRMVLSCGSIRPAPLQTKATTILQASALALKELSRLILGLRLPPRQEGLLLAKKSEHSIRASGNATAKHWNQKRNSQSLRRLTQRSSVRRSRAMAAA